MEQQRRERRQAQRRQPARDPLDRVEPGGAPRDPHAQAATEGDDGAREQRGDGDLARAGRQRVAVDVDGQAAARGEEPERQRHRRALGGQEAQRPPGPREGRRRLRLHRPGRHQGAQCI